MNKIKQKLQSVKNKINTLTKPQKMVAFSIAAVISSLIFITLLINLFGASEKTVAEKANNNIKQTIQKRSLDETNKRTAIQNKIDNLSSDDVEKKHAEDIANEFVNMYFNKLEYEDNRSKFKELTTKSFFKQNLLTQDNLIETDTINNNAKTVLDSINLNSTRSDGLGQISISKNSINSTIYYNITLNKEGDKWKVDAFDFEMPKELELSTTNSMNQEKTSLTHTPPNNNDDEINKLKEEINDLKNKNQNNSNNSDSKDKLEKDEYQTITKYYLQTLDESGNVISEKEVDNE